MVCNVRFRVKRASVQHTESTLYGLVRTGMEFTVNYPTSVHAYRGCVEDVWLDQASGQVILRLRWFFRQNGYSGLWYGPSARKRWAMPAQCAVRQEDDSVLVEYDISPSWTATLRFFTPAQPFNIDEVLPFSEFYR